MEDTTNEIVRPLTGSGTVARQDDGQDDQAFILTALIMAGGSGERFWPLSTPTKPKQLLNLFSEKSMIRETVDRILPIISADKIFIATNILQAESILKELPDIPSENIVIEPAAKDTAAAIGYSSLIIEQRFKSTNKKVEVVVLASDHLIRREEEFRSIIELAAQEASRNSVIVTLGIKPDRPETNYGYIEVKGQTINLNEIHRVQRFREKPNFDTASEYVSSGRYIWNSGMFIFAIETIFKNFEVLMEEHSAIFQQLRKVIAQGLTGKELAQLAQPYFEGFEKISIDYGVMETSKNIRVIPVDIGWSDIGSFTAIAEVFPADANNNVVRDTTVLSHASSGNIVLARGSVVSLLGVEDLIVIKEGDNLLVTSKKHMTEKTSDIKKIVAMYGALKKEQENK